VIPLVVGGALLASHFARAERRSMIPEAAIILFSAIALLFTTERVNPRVAAPFVRFWPLALVLAGIVILKMHRDAPVGTGTRKPDPGMEAVRAVMEDVTHDDVRPRDGRDDAGRSHDDHETPATL